MAFGDADGVAFVPAARVDEVLESARSIRKKERRQAQAVRSGVTLYEQLRYAEFMATREQNPSRTFRQHLEEIGAAIEV